MENVDNSSKKTVSGFVNFSINLFKLKNCGITHLTGLSGETKKCLVIPVEDNQLFVSEKGVYLNMTAIPSDKIENQTHFIKQNFKKEYLETLSDEEKKAMPILGGFSKPKDVTPENNTEYSSAVAESAPADDLPF